MNIKKLWKIFMKISIKASNNLSKNVEDNKINAIKNEKVKPSDFDILV